jgi:hypothetical protein
MQKRYENAYWSNATVCVCLHEYAKGDIKMQIRSTALGVYPVSRYQSRKVNIIK